MAKDSHFRCRIGTDEVDVVAKERRESTQKESPKAPLRTQPGKEAESETRGSRPHERLSAKRRECAQKRKSVCRHLCESSYLLMPTVLVYGRHYTIFSLCCALYKTCSLQTAPRPRRREGLVRACQRSALAALALFCPSQGLRRPRSRGQGSRCNHFAAR